MSMVFRVTIRSTKIDILVKFAKLASTWQSFFSFHIITYIRTMNHKANIRRNCDKNINYE